MANLNDYRQKVDDKYVVLVYGRAGETHETAFIRPDDEHSDCEIYEGSLNTCKPDSETIFVNYNTVGQSVIKVGGDILLYILGSKPLPFLIVGDTDTIRPELGLYILVPCARVGQSTSIP